MKDAGHLIRVVLIFAVGVILFMTARAPGAAELRPVWALPRRFSQRYCRQAHCICRSRRLSRLPSGNPRLEEDGQARGRGLRGMPWAARGACSGLHQGCSQEAFTTLAMLLLLALVSDAWRNPQGRRGAAGSANGRLNFLYSFYHGCPGTILLKKYSRVNRASGFMVSPGNPSINMYSHAVWLSGYPPGPRTQFLIYQP
jgi:hypothetical protein